MTKQSTNLFTRDRLQREHVKYQMISAFSTSNPERVLERWQTEERPGMKDAQNAPIPSRLISGCAERWTAEIAEIRQVIRHLARLDDGTIRSEHRKDAYGVIDWTRFDILTAGYETFLIPKNDQDPFLELRMTTDGWLIKTPSVESLRQQVLYLLLRFWEKGTPNVATYARDLFCATCLQICSKVRKEAVQEFVRHGFAHCSSSEILMGGDRVRYIALWTPNKVIPFDDSTVGEPLSSRMAKCVRPSPDFRTEKRFFIKRAPWSCYPERVDQLTLEEIVKGTILTYTGKRTILAELVGQIRREKCDQALVRIKGEKLVLITHRRHLDYTQAVALREAG